MTRVYISGKITGLTKEEYTRNFQRAEQHYLTAGFEVVNPVTTGEKLLQEKPDASYEDFMKLASGSAGKLHAHSADQRLGKLARSTARESGGRAARIGDNAVQGNRRKKINNSLAIFPLYVYIVVKSPGEAWGGAKI